MTKYLTFLLSVLLLSETAVGNKHASVTRYPSYKGLVMAGYQGWFRIPKDGVMYPDEKQVRIDMWPDVGEYEKTYPTGLKLADGTIARFFGSANKSTADLHFKCAVNPPVSDVAKFVGMDGQPSDHYLWLTGQAAKMLRKEIPLSLKLPERK